MNAEIFWCSKFQQRLDEAICANRQMKKVKGCVTCKQGKMILEKQRGIRKVKK
jgi:hypothetical protein